MPVSGQIPDWTALENYCTTPEKYRHKTRFESYQPGLYCAVGFGSQGATLAPLCAENLIRSINSEPRMAIPELSASRFALRAVGVKPH